MRDPNGRLPTTIYRNATAVTRQRADAPLDADDGVVNTVWGNRFF